MFVFMVDLTVSGHTGINDNYIDVLIKKYIVLIGYLYKHLMILL